MRRSTAAMLAAGGGMLILLVALQRSIGSAGGPAPMSGTASPGTAVREEVPATASERGPAEAIATPAPAAPRPTTGRSPTATAPVMPTEQVAAGEVAPTILDPRTGKPPAAANMAALREQSLAVAPLLDECVAKSGAKPTGKVVLTYTVAPQGDQAVIESTGVDYDESSITDEPLLECLHKTAYGMKFAYVPGSDAVAARRTVTLADGAVVENRVIGFSYLRR